MTNNVKLFRLRWLRTLVPALCALWFVQCAGPGPKKGSAGVPGDSTASSDTVSSQAPTAQPAALTYEQQQGKLLYTKYCAICHGDAGKGDGFNAYSLDPKPRDFTDPRALAGVDDALIRTTIVEGGRGVNKSPLMPAWGGRLNKLETEYVVEYVKALEGRY